MNAATTAGTSPGSVRNVPTIRTVAHCTDQPSRLASRRFDATSASVALSIRPNCSNSPGEGSRANPPYRRTCSSERYSIAIAAEHSDLTPSQ